MAHHDFEAMWAGSVHGFGVGSWAGGAVSVADRGVVALDRTWATSGGAGVTIHCMGSSPDAALGRKLTTYIAVVVVLEFVALSGGRGREEGEVEATMPDEKVDHLGAQHNCLFWE